MRSATLFITGASGFIGRELLGQLGERATDSVVCLSRRGNVTPYVGGVRARLDWIRGSLEDAGSYAAELGPATTVLHLAAMTGKASAAEHDRVNALGTEALVSACLERGVRRLIFVSSIAARYEDLRFYPYARAKRKAEEIVRRSGIPSVIVRPTVVLGRDSPIWLRLRQLGAGSIVPLIGDGRARMQPIHVRDVARVLASLVDDGSADGLLELGGPEALSIVDLLSRIHRLHHTRDPRFVRIPYRPLARTLAALEPWALRFLPVTAGQLAVFVQDSTVEPGDRLRDLWPQMMRVDQILDDLKPKED